MGLKTWKEKRAKAKRDKWELKNLSKKQRENIGLDNKYKGIKLADIVKFIEDLENRIDRLENQAPNIKKLSRFWKVLQDKNGQTIWYKPNDVSYISKISELNGHWMFNMIVGGQVVIIKEDTLEETEQIKLNILNIERIEEFNFEDQEEMFPKNKENNNKQSIFNNI